MLSSYVPITILNSDILAVSTLLFLCLTTAAFYAGTPQGVGPVRVGQKITAGITGLLDVHFDVQRRKIPFSG